MADQYKRYALNISSTALTTIYTVPVGDTSVIPIIKPVTALVRSIIICPKITTTIDVSIVNASTGQTIFLAESLTWTRSNAGLTNFHDEELLKAPLVMETGDILKIQAAAANAVDVWASVLEIRS
tara:strand:+ start:2150 stop:2524 length:375 start_codon:yes stop_codon:yes gene_type:complete